MFSPDRIVGSIVPVITPFKRSSDEVDWIRFAELIDWQIKSGSHGISVTGTSGEPSALTMLERRRAIEEAANVVARRVPLVPGTGTNNLEETIALTKHAEANNADAALVIVPYYNCPSQEGLFRYFAAVAESVEFPILIYNIPGRTSVNMAPETMVRLREHCRNIIGVKESNKDFEHVSTVLRMCGRDFRVYSGIKLLCYPMLTIGGVGYVSATGNVLPTQVAAIWDRYSAGDMSGAAKIHYELMDINKALFVETNPGPVKWVLARMSRIEPIYRLPLCEPSPANQSLLERIAEAYSLLPAEATR